MAAEPGQQGTVYSPLYTQESTIRLPGLIGADSGASSLPLHVDEDGAGTSGTVEAVSLPNTPSQKLLDTRESAGRAHFALEVDADSLLAQGPSSRAALPHDPRPPYDSRCERCAGAGAVAAAQCDPVHAAPLTAHTAQQLCSAAGCTGSRASDQPSQP
jgi:hypothetical protein